MFRRPETILAANDRHCQLSVQYEDMRTALADVVKQVSGNGATIGSLPEFIAMWRVVARELLPVHCCFGNTA
eukprot:3459864-Amphidinium_carterae.2